MIPMRKHSPQQIIRPTRPVIPPRDNSEKKQSFFLRFAFLQNKWVEVFVTWLLFMCFDSIVNWTSERHIFVLYSIIIIYRAFSTRAKLFIGFLLFSLVVDCIAYYWIPHHYIPYLSNFVVLGYLVGCIVGLSVPSALIWIAFCLVDILYRDISCTPTSIFFAIHCFGFGLIMFAYGMLVKIAYKYPKSKISPIKIMPESPISQETTGQESLKEKITEINIEADNLMDSLKTEINHKAKYNNTIDEIIESKKDIQVQSVNETKPISEELVKDTSDLANCLKKEQESKRLLEAHYKKKQQEIKKQMKSMKSEIIQFKESNNLTVSENKKLEGTIQALEDEKQNLQKETLKLEERMKALQKEVKRMESFKTKYTTEVSKHESEQQALAHQKQLLKDEQEKVERMEKELRTAKRDFELEKNKREEIEKKMKQNETLIPKLLSEVEAKQQETDELKQNLLNLQKDNESKKSETKLLILSVQQLQKKNEELEVTLKDETRFKMDLMAELGRSRRELEALYSSIKQS